jgi:L-histidine Nalpha-methyltransferase
MADGTLLQRDPLPAIEAFDPTTAREALAGLRASPKTLPAKLFYDAAGCVLFDEITRLPEYYVTRTEMALLRDIAPVLGATAALRSALIEFGACDETKAAILLPHMASPSAYVPIDVAGPELLALQARMADSHPSLPVHPVEADFLQSVTLPARIPQGRRFGFFPGSTIGNLEPEVAERFLRQAHATLGVGAAFVVGVDLRKSADILIPAYDDAAGVTAAFNRNLLIRLNREAEADFDPLSFRHEARWNGEDGRIEMHLVSRTAQRVRVAGTVIDFAAGESIHTENSYKHTEAGFAVLAGKTGWQREALFTDPARLFSIHLLRAVG